MKNSGKESYSSKPGQRSIRASGKFFNAVMSAANAVTHVSRLENFWSNEEETRREIAVQATF